MITIKPSQGNAQKNRSRSILILSGSAWERLPRRFLLRESPSNLLPALVPADKFKRFERSDCLNVEAKLFRDFQGRGVRQLEADHLRELTPDSVMQLVWLLSHEDTVHTVTPAGLSQGLERLRYDAASRVVPQLVDNEEFPAREQRSSSERQLCEVFESALKVAREHYVRVKADPARGDSLIQLVNSSARGELQPWRKFSLGIEEKNVSGRRVRDKLQRISGLARATRAKNPKVKSPVSKLHSSF